MASSTVGFPATKMTSTRPFSPSLYVGDLDAGATTEDVVAAFAPFGPVTSARVCRDASSKVSLRYAYVNFVSYDDAEAALRNLNHVPLKGKPMRIMWSRRDPLQRKTGIGNVFVKNLDESMGGAELEKLFSAYGTVVSCKVATDEDGKSAGFGFVQMGKEEEARSAIEALNGTSLHEGSKKLYVCKFIKKEERQALHKEPKGTNLFIKNLDNEITDEVLEQKFSEFGKISSAVVMKDNDGKSKGFGFVGFEQPEDGMKAMEAMNGAQLGSKNVYVGVAQKKSDREQQLKLQFADRGNQHIKKKHQDSNVYVKNLSDLVDDKALLELFDGCGKIISAKVMYDKNGQSRRFGFVSFSSPMEAEKAVAKLRGSMLHGKPLYAAIAQRKEDRIKAMQLFFSKILPGNNPPSKFHYQAHYTPNYALSQMLAFTPDHGQVPSHSPLHGQVQQHVMGHYPFHRQVFSDLSSPMRPMGYSSTTCQKNGQYWGLLQHGPFVHNVQDNPGNLRTLTFDQTRCCGSRSYSKAPEKAVGSIDPKQMKQVRGKYRKNKPQELLSSPQLAS